MKIWVDADACPKAIKEILFRAAQREQLELTLVANQALSVPSSAFINSIQVRSGFDEADDEKELILGDGLVTGGLVSDDPPPPPPAALIKIG